MADFKNHRRFSLRCLSKDIIPVSIRLKSNIGTSRSLNILKKVERIRSINNTLEMLECQRGTMYKQTFQSVRPSSYGRNQGIYKQDQRS